MAERLASALVGELLALSDDDLRPLAERLAPFLAATEPAGGFLSVDQTAERLGVHPNTVYRMIVAGRIRATRAGRLWRIPQSELGRIETQEPPPGARGRPLPPPRPSGRFAGLVRDLPYAEPR